MRYPIMTIYGRHGKGDIEITATKENNTPEYLSGALVTGIALYIEQWNDNDLPAMSILICQDGEIKLLRNQGFSSDFVDNMMSHIERMKEDISDYLEEKEEEYA